MEGERKRHISLCDVIGLLIVWVNIDLFGRGKEEKNNIQLTQSSKKQTGCSSF